MKSIMCYLGFHKYTSQELHCNELPSKPAFDATIMRRCDKCESAFIAKSKLPATIIVPTKYIVVK